MKPVEVLAPVGSPEALTAAVRCGATAVYFGSGAFNARRAARNFTPEECRRAVAYCHARGVKVHLTLNTLVRDDEFAEALQTAAMACDAGVDALIVQDTGLARCLRAAAPDMPLHASTQLSCHTPAGVEFLRDAGFSRVVLSREMSRKEIADCVGRGVEIEVFAHGALCMSVSGQCYFSAMLGGRSGNRGTCAQTCRLPFAAATEPVRPCRPDSAALSLKDQCLIDYVRELSEMGVDSLKIEGRLKRPEYVAAAAAVYSAAARGEIPDAAALGNLRSVFSRSGFTDGYYTAQRGGQMFGIRRREDVNATAAVLRDIARTYDDEKPLCDVNMALIAAPDGCRLTVSDRDGNTVTADAPPAEPARERPLDPDRAAAQLKKTGGTLFRAADIMTNITPGYTLPLSQINAMRRDALAALEEKRGEIHPIAFDPARVPADLPAVPNNGCRTVYRLSSAEQWSPELVCDRLILPLDTSAEQLNAIAATGQETGVEIPRGMFGSEDTIRQRLKTAADAGARFALCNNVGAIRPATEAGLEALGGFGLNITNRQALCYFAEHGLRAATLSVELTFRQMQKLSDPPIPVGILIYGRQPLMLTRNCPRRCAGEECRNCRGQGLVDRTGTVFPVICSGGCSEVLNSVPTYWADKTEEIPSVSFRLYHFTTESAEDILRIQQAYTHHLASTEPITRGLYRKGVQ